MLKFPPFLTAPSTWVAKQEYEGCRRGEAMWQVPTTLISVLDPEEIDPLICVTTLTHSQNYRCLKLEST
jgi:hypothetical protein